MALWILFVVLLFIGIGALVVDAIIEFYNW